jgi:class 3 adenylate cyclase
MMFTKLMNARQVTIDATVLFADLRGYTGLSQSLAADVIPVVLDAFYDECAEAIWEGDGLLNKTMGDGLMAIFNFPIERDDHPSRAVCAARAVQRRWSSRQHALVEAASADGESIGVGVGIDSGQVNFGEFGRKYAI